MTLQELITEINTKVTHLVDLRGSKRGNGYSLIDRVSQNITTELGECLEINDWGVYIKFSIGDKTHKTRLCYFNLTGNGECTPLEEEYESLLNTPLKDIQLYLRTKHIKYMNDWYNREAERLRKELSQLQKEHELFLRTY